MPGGPLPLAATEQGIVDAVHPDQKGGGLRKERVAPVHKGDPSRFARVGNLGKVVLCDGVPPLACPREHHRVGAGAAGGAEARDQVVDHAADGRLAAGRPCSRQAALLR